MQGRRSLSKGEPPDKPPPKGVKVVENETPDGSNTRPKEQGQNSFERVVDSKQVEEIDDSKEVADRNKAEGIDSNEKVVDSKQAKVIDNSELLIAMAEHMQKMTEQVTRLKDEFSRELRENTQVLQENIEENRLAMNYQRKADLDKIQSHMSELSHKIRQTDMNVEEVRMESWKRDDEEVNEFRDQPQNREQPSERRRRHDNDSKEIETANTEQGSALREVVKQMLEGQRDITETFVKSIEKIAVDKQVTQSTKTRHREQVIEKASKNQLIKANRAQPDLWLLNLNRLSDQKDWTDSEYCIYLPRLWNIEAKDAWRNTTTESEN